MATDDDDKRAIEAVLDPATRAQLERWFSLPSFEQLADEGKPAPEALDDPEVIAVRERREKAIAAVDPAMLQRIEDRFEGKGEALIKFRATLEVNIDPDRVTCFDQAMAAQHASIAEPRERELPEELRDDLKDCTPQALLRDLHRPELDFDKTFEVVDMAAEQRFDIVAEVAAAMRTSWKLPTLDDLPFKDACALVEEINVLKRTSWPELVLSQTLANRRVKE